MWPLSRLGQVYHSFLLDSLIWLPYYHTFLPPPWPLLSVSFINTSSSIWCWNYSLGHLLLPNILSLVYFIHLHWLANVYLQPKYFVCTCDQHIQLHTWHLHFEVSCAAQTQCVQKWAILFLTRLDVPPVLSTSGTCPTLCPCRKPRSHP